jgi:hypothetical protein
MRQLFFCKISPFFAASFALACATTTLEVRPETAANPDAATMPVPSSSPALKNDFDPWASTGAATAHEGHEGHEGHQEHEGHEGHEGHQEHEGHEGHQEHEGHEGHHD